MKPTVYSLQPTVSGLRSLVYRPQPPAFFRLIPSVVCHPSSVAPRPDASERVRRPPSPLHRPSGQVCRPSSVICRLSSGFTLIEVLVAMTVLSVMVLMVANIFQSSSAAWNIGTQKADMNTAARAALDFMARELASAVAGPIDKAGSGGAPNLQFRQAATNDIRFLALAQDPNSAGNVRALRGVFFWQANQALMVYWKTNLLDCYSAPSPTWHADTLDPGNMLITNVLSLEFYVYTNETALASGPPVPNFNITHEQLPLCVDIALEMLSDDDMRRYNQLSGAPQTEFKNRNAKLYSTRIYFPNRKGYQAR